MKKYVLPAGYSFFASISRTLKQVKDPIGSMEESMKQFISTQDPALIEYVLKGNHRNYDKSEFQTKQLGRFLGKGLLTSNGEFWLRQRRLIQPGFHYEKIQALYSNMKGTVDDSLNQFPLGEGVNVYPLMNRLAFDIVVNALFNVKIEERDRNELSSFVYETQDFVIRDIRQPYKSWWYALSGEVKRNLEKSSRAREIIRQIIQGRKASKTAYNDLLDMLLNARYEDTGLAMDEEQLIDEILVLIIAGHETTANALSWTLYLLANHPHELQNLVENTSGLDLPEVVKSEPVNAVIKESMRLYPPAWISDRVTIKDDQFKDFSYPAGTIIILFYYGLHRDKKHWSDPQSFKPERFLKGAEGDKNRCYFPFGAGPRLCIGNNFAMAEMAIFLHSFIHRFDIKPGTVQPVVVPLVTLKPDKIILNISAKK
jgi:cytochrome P450